MEKSLYNIVQEQRFSLLEIEEMEGELTPELEERMVINANQLSSKSIAYLEVISSKESFNVLITNEIKRLQAIKKRNDNLITRLKDNLLNAVKMFGSFEVGFTKFGTRKSSTVEVEDVNMLHSKYKVTKITEQADKEKIKEDLKSGVEIDGCYIKDHQNLKIN